MRSFPLHRSVMLIPLLLFSCVNSRKLEQGSLFSSKEQTEPIGLEKFEGLTDFSGNDPYESSSDTATISGISYKAFVTDDFDLYIIAKDRDTLLAQSGLPPHPEFLDFNGDGFKDLAVHHPGNGSERMELMLYNPLNNSFDLVENFADFPAAKPIAGTPYYYSYRRSGCADQNWNSDLFFLESSKAVLLGTIRGNTCEDEPEGIYISTLRTKQSIHLETLPLSVLDSYQDYKWGFIQDYWTKNWKRFASATDH